MSSPEAVSIVDILKREKRTSNDFLGRFYDPLECFPLSCSATCKPQRDAVAQDSLNGAAIKAHQHFLLKIVLPEDPQEIQSLLGLFQKRLGVYCPGQVLLNVHAQEPEVRDSLPALPVHIDGLNVRLIPPIINDGGGGDGGGGDCGGGDGGDGDNGGGLR